MYSPICQGGNLHDIAEDIHWGRFQEVAWNYFRKTYPNPIGNDDAEKLIAFMMGLVSHQVSKTLLSLIFLITFHFAFRLLNLI